MNGFLLFLLAYFMGFFASIPLGASQIEMGKRAIRGRLFAARMVVLGSVSSDTLYGALALFGVAPFLDLPWVLNLFNAVGAITLWVLAYLTMRESKKPHDPHLEQGTLANDRWAYLTGFTLAFSNMSMILTWLFGVAIAKRFGLASPFPAHHKALFIGGGAIGLATYPNILATVLYRVKHFISMKAMSRVYYWLGVALFAFSSYFLFSLAKGVLKLTTG